MESVSLLTHTGHALHRLALSCPSPNRVYLRNVYIPELQRRKQGKRKSRAVCRDDRRAFATVAHGAVQAALEALDATRATLVKRDEQPRRASGCRRSCQRQVRD